MSAEEWTVDISQDGPSGYVTYREGSREIRCWWEFGSGDVVACIRVGTSAEWTTHHPWAAPDRALIVQRIVDEAIRQRAPRCRATLDDAGWLTLRG